ncbi:MAG: hypothetical protein ACPF9D_02150 [Owenweeksia sp.]
MREQLKQDVYDNTLEVSLQKLGTLILLLDHEELEKLNTVSKAVLDIEKFALLENLERSFTSFEEFFLADIGFEASFSDSVDFGGFDGGDFGGGGSFGDW